jgi:1,4-alpha-glucan branching enzyme
VRSSAAAIDNMPVTQEFVLEAAQANRVALVGDFNSWNPKANVMTRDAAGKWSTTVQVVPGRHVYGFMVNDSIFTLDPHAMKARDPDLGGDGSVRMVGRP